MKNIKALFHLITVIFVLTACQSVSTKIDKTTEQEKKELSQWLNKSESDLKSFFGQPDKVEFLKTRNRNYVYIKEKYNGSHVYYLIRALFCEEELVSIFSNSNIYSKEIEKNFKKTQDLIDSKACLSSIDLISYLELTEYMAPALLRDTDMMSMAHSLEVRVPLIDHKLVELMFSIPSSMKINQRSPKRLLVDSLKLKLPDSVVNRKKMGFTLPFNDWMKGEMRSEIETVLLSPSDKLSAFISEEEIKKIWVKFLENRCSWSRPWSIYVLKKWIDINL